LRLIDNLSAFTFSAHYLINSLFQPCIEPEHQLMMSESRCLHRILPAPLDFLPYILDQSLPVMKLSPLILQGVEEILGGEDSPFKKRVKVLIEHCIIYC
jgi:hypothetical protein